MINIIGAVEIRQEGKETITLRLLPVQHEEVMKFGRDHINRVFVVSGIISDGEETYVVLTPGSTHALILKAEE